MIESNQLYHIFNQSNNHQKLFYQEKNYKYFLEKVNKHLKPICDIIAYCLMPNHFHFLLYTNANSIEQVTIGQLQMSRLAFAYRNIQSSYSKGINKQQNRSGALFRQKAKYKLVENSDKNYPFIAFHYIHQNPMKAGLIEKMENWKFSSFNEYWKNSPNICNLNLARELIDFGDDEFYDQSYAVMY